MKTGVFALALLFFAPFSAWGTVQLPVSYNVDYKTLKTVITGTPVTFELHTDPSCVTAAVLTQTINVENVAHIDVLKRLTPKGALKAPQTAQLNHSLSGAPAERDLYLKVVGAGVVPVGGSCQPQHATVHYTATDNTFVGQSAGSLNTSGSFNTAVGNQALKSNQTGISNTAVGNRALQNSTVSHNTAVGQQCMQNATTGTPNVGVGEYALISLTTGAFNTAVGTSALSANQTGISNTAVGHGALQNTSVSHNTAIGEQAMQNATTGSQNVGAGEYALINLTTGGNNVAVGVGATANITSGSSNVALGFNAGANRTGGDSNNIDIGNAGVAGESNAVKIGNASHAAATNVSILGIYGGGVNGTGVNVMVDNSGKLGVGFSSARFKEDIQDMGDSTDGLMKLRPVRFHYKGDIDPSALDQYGLVAEEVAKVYPDLVMYDEKGAPLSVRYHLVNAMLLNEMQKQARRLDTQEQRLGTQEQLIRAQAEALAELKTRLVAVQATSDVSLREPRLASGVRSGVESGVAAVSQ